MTYPDPEENKKRYAAASAQAIKAGLDPWDQRFIGPQTTIALYEDASQYAKFRFAIFTEATHVDKPEERYGHKFARLIEKKKLGTLVVTDRQLNPNSGHNVQVWVWGIDHEALRAWYKKIKKEEKWEPKPMSDVIGRANVAGTLSGSPLGVCGTTIASVGSASISNGVWPTSGSSSQTTRG